MFKPFIAAHGRLTAARLEAQSASQMHPTKSVSETPIFMLKLAPEPPFSLCRGTYRDANQSDFIVFRTTNRAKYDNTILPIKIRFSPMSVFRSLSLFFFLISYQTITLVWHFISLLSSGETLPK